MWCPRQPNLILSNFDVYIDHKDLSSIQIATGSILTCAGVRVAVTQGKKHFLDLILMIVILKVVLIQMHGQFP